MVSVTMYQCKWLSFRCESWYMNKTVGILVPVIVVGASLAQAQEGEVEEVVIWGTSVKSSSVFMGADDLEVKQADHISDLLRNIPGIDVGGAHSLNQRITIRSIEDRDIRITIDGASQNNYIYHHMGNLQIHADILKAVDIEVGTNSVIHGGLGGRVRFETKTARELLADGKNFGGILKGSLSSNASDDVSLTLFAEQGDFDALAYYNRVEKKNFEVGGGQIKGSDGLQIPDTDGKVRGLEGTVDSVLLKTGWNINNHHRLEFGYEYYKDEGDYSYRPDMGLATDIAISDGTGTPLLWPTEYTRDTLTLNYDGEFGETDIKATAFDNSSRLWRNESGYAESSIPAFQGFAGIIEGLADNYGANVLVTTQAIFGNEHELTYGANFTRYETNYEAQYTSGSTDTSGEDKTDQSFFVQDQIQLGAGFSLTPGFRYDRVDVSSTVIEDTFNETSLALAAEFQASDAWVFRLSSTELFQAPELSEVFIGAGIFDQINPELEAETGRNDEFAIAYGEAVFGADKFTAGATIFNTVIENYIYDYAPKDNVGDVTVDGFEAYVGYQLGQLDTLLTYSANDSDLDAFAEYSGFDGARLDRTQGDTLSFKLSYELESLNLKLHWDFQIVDDLNPVDANLQLDGAGTDNSKDGFDIHNISANWQANTALSVTIGIDNVFDEFYVSQSSRTGATFHPLFGSLFLNDYEPGRNVKATVNYRF